MPLQADGRIQLRAFSDRKTWSESIAGELVERVATSGPENSEFHLVLPGGSSPNLVLEVLSQCVWPQRELVVFPSDERAVPSTDDRRNDVKLAALSQRHQHLRLIQLLEEPSTPAQMLSSLEKKLTTRRPLNLAVLGMGLDGHIASIFPSEEAVAQAESRSGHCLWAQRRGEAFLRLSLGWTKLLQAEEIWLMMLGQDKLNALQAWLASTDMSRPVVRLLQERHVTLYWSS